MNDVIDINLIAQQALLVLLLIGILVHLTVQLQETPRYIPLHILSKPKASLFPCLLRSVILSLEIRSTLLDTMNVHIHTRESMTHSTAFYCNFITVKCSKSGS